MNVGDVLAMQNPSPTFAPPCELAGGTSALGSAGGSSRQQLAASHGDRAQYMIQQILQQNGTEGSFHWQPPVHFFSAIFPAVF